jgi:MFS superfamily sulfate permease-like transporter/carbonic anhydrase
MTGLKTATTLPRDLIAGLVVFLVALPLCLGVALASNAPPIAGLIAGIVGGILVGLLSGSQTSVSGPAAGLTAVVAAQIAALGSFEAFLVAVVLAGVLQVIMGVCRAGFISAFFPLSVIKGLLAAIGVILILKQIPHLLGHDTDPMGDKSFQQQDGENTFSELAVAFFDVHPGAILVGVASIALIVFWDKVKVLKQSPVPAPLIVVVLGVLLNQIFQAIGGALVIEPSHLVAVPVTAGPGDFIRNALMFPDWNVLSNPVVYSSAVTIAVVASLETLLNIEAVDKIDPKQRATPPNRELLAQGVGNIAAGLIGGLPMTSVIVRSSVNINAKAETKVSAIWHGVLLIGCVMLVPALLNQIPLAALAAILLMTGLKLASPKLIRQMWSEGQKQFLPFIITIVAIVLTDLLIGVLIGLAVSIGFILHNNARRPLRRILEKHVSGDVMHIVLANQVSFLSRASLEQALRSVPRGGHILLDASNTDYIDPDVLDLITDFRDTTAGALGVKLSFKGFRDRYPQLQDHIQYVDYSSRELLQELTPERVLQLLQEGNERFLGSRPLTRDQNRLVEATSGGQFPMAAVLGCIDSRAPAEVVFDLGLGDIFSARVAGNIATPELLGSLEYACAVVGSKLVVVLGHTSCGAVNAAVDLLAAAKKASEATPCGNLDGLVTEIQQSINPATLKKPDQWSPGEKVAYANEISRHNVMRTIRMIRQRSATLDKLVLEGKIAIVGALYDVSSGRVDFFQTTESSLQPLPVPMTALPS